MKADISTLLKPDILILQRQRGMMPYTPPRFWIKILAPALDDAVAVILPTNQIGARILHPGEELVCARR